MGHQQVYRQYWLAHGIACLTHDLPHTEYCIGLRLQMCVMVSFLVLTMSVALFCSAWIFSAISPISKFWISVAVISQALSSQEIKNDWDWLTQNLVPLLSRFESDEDVTEFVCCKISSLVANDMPSSKDVDG